MGFLAAIKKCLRKYAGFSGRASRPEYWNFVLFIMLGLFVLGVVDTALFGGEVTVRADGVTVQSNGPLGGLFGLLTALPLFTAGWRRMHDSGRSGVYLLYPLIVMLGITTFLGFLAGFGPFSPGTFQEAAAGVGMVVLICALLVLAVSPLIVVWWLARPSEAGDNLYGPPPVAQNTVK